MEFVIGAPDDGVRRVRDGTSSDALRGLRMYKLPKAQQHPPGDPKREHFEDCKSRASPRFWSHSRWMRLHLWRSFLDDISRVSLGKL